MSKTKELSQVIDELRNTATSLLSVADSLSDLFSGTGGSSKEVKQTTKPPKPKEKLLTLESVRAVLAEKARIGFTAEVKLLIEKHGAARLSDIHPKVYQDLLGEVKVLGNG